MRLKKLSEGKEQFPDIDWRVARLEWSKNDEPYNVLGYGRPDDVIKWIDGIKSHKDFTKIPQGLQTFKNNTEFLIMHHTPSTERILSTAINTMVLAAYIYKSDLAGILERNDWAGEKSVDFHTDDKFEQDDSYVVWFDGQRAFYRDDEGKHEITGVPFGDLPAKLTAARQALLRLLKLTFHQGTALTEGDLRAAKGWQFFIPGDRQYDVPVNYDLAHKYYAARLLQKFDRWESTQRAYEEVREAIAEGVLLLNINIEDWPELTGKEETFHTDDTFGGSGYPNIITIVVKPQDVVINKQYTSINIPDPDLEYIKAHIPLDVIEDRRQALEQCKETMTRALDAYVVDSGWLPPKQSK